MTEMKIGMSSTTSTRSSFVSRWGPSIASHSRISITTCRSKSSCLGESAQMKTRRMIPSWEICESLEEYISGWNIAYINSLQMMRYYAHATSCQAMICNPNYRYALMTYIILMSLFLKKFSFIPGTTLQMWFLSKQKIRISQHFILILWSIQSHTDTLSK